MLLCECQKAIRNQLKSSPIVKSQVSTSWLSPPTHSFQPVGRSNIVMSQMASLLKWLVMDHQHDT